MVHVYKEKKRWRHSVFPAQVSVCPLSLFIRDGGAQVERFSVLC